MMTKSKAQANLPTGAGRSLVAVLAAIPLLLAGFVVGYGVGVGNDSAPPTIPGAWEGAAPGESITAPDIASFTASGIGEYAPADPSVIPVGYTDDLGIAVTHLQFSVDESTLQPDHTAELRLPVLTPPQSDVVLLEVASVEPVDCICTLSAASAPPYGRVWDAVSATSETTEVVFDVTGAFDAPGRYGFAVTTPDTDAYLEFHGAAGDGIGPSLDITSTVTDAKAPTSDATPTEIPAGEPTESPTALPPWLRESGQADSNLHTCSVGEKLIPSCGALVGVAPAAHTNKDKENALLDFEERVGRQHHIYHAYERADKRVFPTPDQIELTQDPENPRTLFINWKPQIASWAAIADGDERVDAYLDRLAAHLRENFTDDFFFTVHHEPENDVIQKAGSGYEAADYAEMYRYVIEYLRGAGVDNLVTVMNYMSYLKWVSVPWHDQIYPGDDVVDWLGWSSYGHSTSATGDFASIVNQRGTEHSWPGYYHWSIENHPTKPIMLAEWGVFYHRDNPRQQQAVFEAAAAQLAYYPRLKAIVYFESPNAEGRSSEVDVHEETLEAYRSLMSSRDFDVSFDLGGP